MALTKEEYIEYTKNKIPAIDINKKYYDLYLDFLASNHSKNTCRKLFHQFYLVFIKFFANTPLENINRQSICNNITDYNKEIYYITDFILFLIDNNVDLDSSLILLENIRDLIGKKGWGFDDIYKAFKEPNKVLLIKTNSDKARLYFLDVDDVELREILKEFVIKYNTKFADSHINLFTQHFSKGLTTSPNLNNLSYDTYVQHLNYYKQFNTLSENLRIISSFYYFVGIHYRPNIVLDKGLELLCLTKPGFANFLIDGYEIVIYNPIEEISLSDKWLFVHNNNNVLNSNIVKSGCITLDFTKIKNKTYRDWAKMFIGKKVGSNRPNNILSILVEFCNYITDLKAGKILSIYTAPTSCFDISANEVMAYKTMIINKTISDVTKLNYLFVVKSFLSFLNQLNVTEIPFAIEYMLSKLPLNQSSNNAKSIPMEDLEKIAELMQEKSKHNVVNKLYYLIFYIMLGTEFRPSQILALEADCIREANKPNEYVLVSQTKTSAGEKVEQPISIYTKRHIDEIIKITQPIREKYANHEFSKYLFLYQSRDNDDSLNIVSINGLRTHFKNCCKELSLDNYVLNNLRDTYMTKAEEYVIRNKMSDIQQNILSGHKSPTVDNQHYVDTDIKTLLESVHGVIIGNVDINGQIISNPSDIMKPENEVSNGCGYCNRNSCNEYTMLDCMMCKNFVTTPDRLPYFEEQVKILDYKIGNATIPHDKEDLINIKRLYLEFINKLLNLKKGDNDD